ncbi:hypothetical protein EK904_005464, partial [Melospiza melodia maxima]
MHRVQIPLPLVAAVNRATCKAKASNSSSTTVVPSITLEVRDSHPPREPRAQTQGSEAIFTTGKLLNSSDHPDPRSRRFSGRCSCCFMVQH